MPITRRSVFRSSRPYAAALLALSLATGLAACSDLLGPGSDGGRPFFYYQDQKIYLRVDTRTLTAVPEAEGDSATLRAVLRQSGISVDSMRPMHQPGHWLVHLPSGTSARRAESAARALRFDAGVRFASAVYRQRDGNCPLYMVNRLTVQFLPGADEAAIDQLNAGMGVRNEQVNPWGTRSYEFPRGLVATPLELAALYHRHRLVDWAEADRVDG
ncbi:MAG TPA: hypothetical protein VEQ60_11745, partial [Longimicrobium sp.]|nr:hypothetical protein [Longimicrobium sp.]